VGIIRKGKWEWKVGTGTLLILHFAMVLMHTQAYGIEIALVSLWPRSRAAVAISLN